MTDISVTRTTTLVFEKFGAGAAIYGMVSIFPSEGGFCVSDLEALKVRCSTIPTSTVATDNLLLN